MSEVGQGGKPVDDAARSGGKRRSLPRRLLRGLLWLAGAGLAAGLLAFCALVVWINLSGDRGPDVLLISLDTQRIDGFGCYGGAPDLTPNLDRLAADGVLFERAVVSIPRTTQNVTTLLTGLEPRDHGVRELYDRVPDEVVTLAERLRELGYRTAAFVGGGPLGVDQNIYQGFDHVDEHTYDRQARALPKVAAASSWITRNAAGPWFVWVHLYDPHFYYAPPWPFWDGDHPEADTISELYETLAARRGSFGKLHYENDLSESQRDYLRELYRGETRSVDWALGLLLRLVGLYERLDPGRETLVVLTADHGEGLGEHGCYYTHGTYLYDEDLLVPLILSLPGTLPAERRIPWQVRTIDIFPTILDLLGDRPPTAIAGRSLLPMVAASERRHRVAFAEGDTSRHEENPRFYVDDALTGRWRAVRDGHYKLIRVPREEGDLLELYDLEQDPGETRNLAAEDPATVERLLAMLEEWETRPSVLDVPVQPEIPEDELDERIDRLRSLGYVN